MITESPANVGVCFYQRESLPGYSAIFRHPNDELNYCYYLIPHGKDGMCGDVKVAPTSAVPHPESVMPVPYRATRNFPPFCLVLPWDIPNAIIRRIDRAVCKHSKGVQSIVPKPDILRIQTIPLLSGLVLYRDRFVLYDDVSVAPKSRHFEDLSD
jgi:hypothetical protein